MNEIQCIFLEYIMNKIHCIFLENTMYILGEYNVYSWRIQCIFLENTMNNSNNKINTFSE